MAWGAPPHCCFVQKAPRSSVATSMLKRRKRRFATLRRRAAKWFRSSLRSTKQDQCDALVKLALNTYGGIDVVYNNAAMAYFGWMDEFTVEDYVRTINEELVIVFRFCKTVWPHLVARGGGSIINTASTSAKVAYKVLPGIAHTSAKGGVLAMTRQLAMEGGKHNIRANTISPGLIETAQTRELIKTAEFIGPMMDKLMVGRVGKPEDVAPAAVFLASNESSFITGADIAVDGGTTAW